MANYLTSNGITWTFDRELTLTGASSTYQYGTYCNGDYWVVGPATIISQSPSWNGSSGGTELNCIPDGTHQGLTGSTYYTASRNIASTYPRTIQPNSSLLSARGSGNCGSYLGDRTRINYATVLTIVSIPPPNGSFRPGYAGSDKTIYGNESDIRYDRLARVPNLSGGSSLATHAGRLRYCFPTHNAQWNAYLVITPCSHGWVGYGNNNAARIGEAILTANCDYTAQEKRDLVVGLIQFGIDIYSVAMSQTSSMNCWEPDGGHGMMLKLPVMFAGAVLDNAALLSIADRTGQNFGNADYIDMAPDNQTFYVAQSDVNRGIGYSAGDIGTPEYMIRHTTYPYYDANANSWASSYRSCCTGSGWGAGALAFAMMSAQGFNIKAAYNHMCFFEYMDRFIDHFGSPDDFSRHPNSGWVRTMWNTYRAAYAPVWPDEPSTDTTPPVAPSSLISPQQSDTTIHLSWTAGGQAADGDYPIGYRIYRDSVLITSITGTSYIDTGLTANTSYDYSIYSYDDAGNDSVASADNTFSTEVAPTPVTTVYINGSGNSGNGGTAWNDALRFLPAVLTRGATYYIGTGFFGQYTFNDAKNSNTITIQKATLTNHGSETGWNPDYAGQAQWGNLTFDNTSYIDFLGGSTNQTLIQHSEATVLEQTLRIEDSDRINVDYCEIDGMNGGIGNLACYCVLMYTCTFVKIDHCNIHDAADDILQMLTVDDCSLLWNRIHTAYSQACGIGGSNGHSDAIEFNGNCNRCEIIGNLVYDCPSTSCLYFVYTSNFSDFVIANNIFYNNRNTFYTVYLGGTIRMKFYNNIVWGYYNGIAASDSGLGITPGNTYLDIRNNILGSVNTVSGGIWSQTNIGDYNIIHSVPAGYTPGANDLIGVDPEFTNINTTGAVNSNPTIADFAPLNETAASVDAGVAIAEVSYDIQHSSRPQGVGYDIGAFEYAGAVVTTGACCNPSTGECSITTEAQCSDNWLGAGSTCLDCETPIPIEGMIISYTCSETSGYTVADASGEAINGSLINTSNGYANGTTELTGSEENHEGEVYFDNVYDGIILDTPGFLADRGTIAMAVYPETVTGLPPDRPATESPNMFLFGHSVGTWSNRIQLWIVNGYYQLGLGDNHFLATDIVAATANEWAHIILTWIDDGLTISNGTVTGTTTGSGTWSFYLDGIVAGSGSYSGLSQAESIIAFGNTGKSVYPSNVEAFDGYMDNMKIYDIPLDASQAADLAYLDGKESIPIPPTIDPPVIINTTATAITPHQATVGGEITDTGGEIPIVTLYYGETDEGEVAGSWDSSVVIGAILDSFVFDLGGLTHNTTYFYRCYATNAGGSDWADSSETFNTLEITAPTLTQDAASNVAITTVTLSGDITDRGNEDPFVLVYWGETDEGEVAGSWTSFANVVLQSDDSFSIDLTGLTANTTYFFVFYAENSTGGGTWGVDALTFDTDPTGAPIIINAPATEIEGIQAIIGGEVTDVGLENPTVTLYWGTADGSVTPGNWENSASFGVQTGEFEVLITGLSLATIYYYRAYATNAFGEDWANSTQSFSTLAVQPISPDPNDKADGFLWGSYDNAYEIVTPYSEIEVFDIHKVSRGDVTFMAHGDHWPRKLTRYGERNWTIEEIDFVGGPFLDDNIDTDKTCQYVNGTGGTTGNYYDVDNAGTIDASGHTPFLEEMVGSLWRLQHTRQDNTVDEPNNVTHATPTGDGIRIKGDWQFDVSNMLDGTNPNFTAKIWRKALPGNWQEIRHYSGATLASGDEEEEDVYYTWTADNAAVEGVFSAIGARNLGIVKITSFISTSQVACVIKKAVYQESDASAAVSDWAEGAWNGYRGYPTSVTFYGNRLWWSGNVNNPQGLWGSRVGYYEDHTSGVSDSDAISRTISDNDVSSIEWLTAAQALMIGSAKKEYIASAADRRDPITPKDLEVRPHSTNGSLPIQPVEIDGGMMYAQRLGYKMLLLYYEYLNDSYQSVDANRLSPHMFKYPATGMAKQGTPETVVWVTREDGTLCDFRYDKNEEIAAWSRIVTGGTTDSPSHAYISVAVVAGDTEDRVWTVVQRIVNGETHYYVERFANRNYIALSDSLYLDCATTITTDNLGTLSRLYYLEGHTVTVMLDTDKLCDCQIIDGQITGLEPDTEYTIGLPYLCRLKTMMFAVPGAVTEGRVKRFLNVLVRTVRTRGGQIGVESHGQTNMVDMDIEYSLLAADNEEFGEGGFDKDSRIILEFNDPYPATVLCLVFEVDIL